MKEAKMPDDLRVIVVGPKGPPGKNVLPRRGGGFGGGGHKILKQVGEKRLIIGKQGAIILQKRKLA